MAIIIWAASAAIIGQSAGNQHAVITWAASAVRERTTSLKLRASPYLPLTQGGGNEQPTSAGTAAQVMIAC